VDKITALGVVINDRLTATDHVSYVLTACSILLYALRVLRKRLDSFLRRCVKLGFSSSNNTPCISTIAEDIEDTWFNKVTYYHYRILHHICHIGLLETIMFKSRHAALRRDCLYPAARPSALVSHAAGVTSRFWHARYNPSPLFRPAADLRSSPAARPST